MVRRVHSQMLRWRCLKVNVKDFLFVGGFASIFLFMGTVILLFFSIGSQIECDRWKNTCTLQYQYAFGDSELFNWPLSDTSKVYVSTSYPKGSSEEVQNHKLTHRAVIGLTDGRLIPWTPEYSTDKKVHEMFVNEFTSYISTNSLTAVDNGRFVRQLNRSWIQWGAFVLYLTGVFVAVWGWWLNRTKR